MVSQNLAVVDGSGLREEFMRAPFVVRALGSFWRCATDGRLLVAITDGAGHEPVTGDRADGVASLLTAPGALPLAVGIDVAALAAWTGPHEGAPICQTCHGTPPKRCETCGGDGRVHCKCECGDVHDIRCGACHGRRTGCDECDDTGKGDFPERLGILLGHVINRNLLALGLLALNLTSRAEADLIENAGSRYPAIRLAGDGWRMLMMPMVWDDRTGLPEFPA